MNAAILDLPDLRPATVHTSRALDAGKVSRDVHARYVAASDSER